MEQGLKSSRNLEADMLALCLRAAAGDAVAGNAQEKALLLLASNILPSSLGANRSSFQAALRRAAGIHTAGLQQDLRHTAHMLLEMGWISSLPRFREQLEKVCLEPLF